MAKTLKLNVSFPMTIVVATDTITALKATREEARLIHSEKIAKLNGETKFRAGIREFITRYMRNKIAGNEAKIRLGSVKVSFEDNSLLARSCDCNACHECKIANGGRDE